MTYLSAHNDMCVHTHVQNIPLHETGFFWWLNNVSSTEKGHGDNLLMLTSIWYRRILNERSRVLTMCKNTAVHLSQNRKEPITACYTCVLSALRLSVWLCDNWYIHLFYVNKGFLSAFRAVQRKVFQFCIYPHLQPCFAPADRSINSFCFLVHFLLFSR